MDEQRNYLGAAIFWLYIFAALAFTSITLKTLHDIRPANQQVNKKHSKLIILFSVLAAISFATLSYNMLNVLIDSYTLWAHERSSSLADASLSSIWRWSITSTLFKDFGNALVQSSARYLWVESSLLATLCVCFHVGVEGQYRSIPRLWALIGLSQVLPVSFTQNLFYIALLRSGPGRPQWAISKGMVVLLAGAYCACLIIAPITARTALLIPHILLARALLVAMQIYPWTQGSAPRHEPATDDNGLLDREDLSSFLALIATLCGFAQASLTLLEEDPRNVGSALFSHPAVSSLGCDFFLSAVSYVCWRSIRGTESAQTREKTE